MIPSRGLGWSRQAIGLGRRSLEPFSARQFSSASITHTHAPIRANPFLPSSTLRKLTQHFPLSKSNLLLRGNVAGVSIRFASTAPAIPTPPVTAPIPSPAPEAVAPEPTASVSDIFDFSSSDSILNTPEHIGYLRSLGFDFGWGPSSAVQFLLEHIHVYAGTPWWASIALLVIGIRLALFKPYLLSAENATRTATVMPITKPISAKMRLASATSDMDTVMACRQELSLINKRAGIKYRYMLIPLIQAVLGFCSWRVLSGMAHLPVPGLEDGGVLWFYNLSISDPYFILPFATATLLHLMFKKGGEMGVQTMSPGMMKGMMYGLPVMSFAFTSWIPAAIQWLFLVSGAMSFGQSTLLRQTWFRSYFKLTPLPTPKKPDEAVPSPYKGTMKRAAYPVFSTAEISSRFQGPTGASDRVIQGKLSKSEPAAAAEEDNEEDRKPSKIGKVIEGLKKGQVTKTVSQVIDETKRDAKKSVRSIMASGQSFVGQSKEKVAEKMAKQDLQERKRFEEKRKEEEKMEKWELDQERRAERQQKKLDAMERSLNGKRKKVNE